MQELINALHIIKEECEKHDEQGCYECPMFCDEHGGCSVTNTSPNNWEINDHIQRALL